MTSTPSTTANLGCIVLAHDDPVQVRRLIAALDPFPVFLHCDARAPEDTWRAMTHDLPARCTLLPRRATPWARWPVVQVEIDAFRTALAAAPELTHLAVLSGADYPLVSTERISAFLAEQLGRSILTMKPLPYANWGRSGGYSRLRFPHTSFRRQIVPLPFPRRLPAGIAFAGGEHWKILARDHAQAVVEVADTRPDLLAFWKRSWASDETFVPSVLNTPAFVPGFAADHIDDDAWYIAWNRPRQQSPPFLDVDDLATLEAAAAGADGGLPRLLARKFSTARSTELLDRIDRFRSGGVRVDGSGTRR